MAVVKIVDRYCNNFDIGLGKYRNQCKNQHGSEDCRGRRTRKNCSTRHRIFCKYGELCRHQENCDFRHEGNRQSNVASVSKIDNLSRTVKLIQNNIVGLENKIT